MTQTPSVELWAHTTITPNIEKMMGLDPEASDGENLIEAAGRSCYESFHKPNPATAKNRDYLKRTVFGQGHGSIAEHATATVYITGVSRALTHELVRHRHLSFSQLSQRFVNSESAPVVVPPAIREYIRTEEDGGQMLELVNQAADENYRAYTRIVDSLTAVGLPRKQAREAARAVLPNMVETRIVVTGNYRTWAEVIQRRAAPDADAEFQEVAMMILNELEKVSPAYFGMVREKITEANQ